MRIPVALAVVLGLASSSLATITIPTVPIGHTGNLPDPTTGYGSVAYAYRIGITEVTNAQYAAFLNAVAATDTHTLYHGSMDGTHGGIAQTGGPGGYTYSAITGRENNPVNFVSFYDAARFANWLHNGQPTGPQNASTTEDGAYTLTPSGIGANTIARNAGWRWAVTSEDEWYKAAYHQPATDEGDADDYWLYPTSSNTITDQEANYNAVIGTVTPVGSYATNYYGLFDMGGNVYEWTESISGADRCARGGNYLSSTTGLRATHRFFTSSASTHGSGVGFRVSWSGAPSCLGDINGNGHVNVSDFNILASNFGQTVAPNTSGDLTGDGLVNVSDFNILAGNFGCGS